MTNYYNLPLFRSSFLEYVAKVPAKIACTFVTGRKLDAVDYTYQELHNRANVVAKLIIDNHLVRERVGIPAGNNIDFVIGLLGCLYAGAIAVPVPLALHGVTNSRGDHILQSASLAALLVFPGFVSKAKPEEYSCKFISVDLLAGAVQIDLRYPELFADDIAIIQFTSGSGGNPSGVCISHKALVYNLAIIQEAMGHTVTHNLRGLNWCPFYHDMGLIGGLLNPLYTGVHVVQMSPVDFIKRPLSWLFCIDRYRVTITGGPTFAYQLLNSLLAGQPETLAQLDLSCWQAAFCGAEPINPDILQQFAALAANYGFKPSSLLPCYGMAEFTLFVTGARFGNGMKTVTIAQNGFKRDIVSCGVPYGDTRFAVISESGEQQDALQVGEIYLTGSSMFSGYFSGGMLGDNTVLVDSERYFATGDIGFHYEGEIYITGRKKNVIIVNGVNYFPHDVIADISVQFPELDPLKGVVLQSDIYKQTIYVFHELKRGITLEPQEIQQLVWSATNLVKTLLGVQEVIFHIFAQGALQKTSSGKIIVKNDIDFYNVPKWSIVSKSKTSDCF